MPSFEEEQLARSSNCGSIIAGIDEAGRGPLAGPVLAAAVIFPPDYHPSWLAILDDSKKLSAKKRDLLYGYITSDPQLTYCIAQASVQEIDEINILQATYRAMERAVTGLATPPDYCLIDGRPVPNFIKPSKGIVKGDSKSYSIAAASILAKVERDRLLLIEAQNYPQYEFARHKGYGTKVHLEALQKHGPCPLHRLSFSPVQRALERDPSN